MGALVAPVKDMPCRRSCSRKRPALTVATMSSGAVASIGTHVGRCDVPSVVGCPHD